jgi:hypothetical protein
LKRKEETGEHPTGEACAQDASSAHSWVSETCWLLIGRVRLAPVATGRRDLFFFLSEIHAPPFLQWTKKELDAADCVDVNAHLDVIQFLMKNKGAVHRVGRSFSSSDV